LELVILDRDGSGLFGTSLGWLTDASDAEGAILLKDTYS
jgi:hypothetical protein